MTTITCPSCKSDDPGGRYRHYLTFSSTDALAEHLSSNHFKKDVIDSILDWYRTVFSIYGDEARRQQSGLGDMWQSQQEVTYTVRSLAHAKTSAREFYDDMADLGLDPEQAQAYAIQQVRYFLKGRAIP